MYVTNLKYNRFIINTIYNQYIKKDYRWQGLNL